MTINIHERSYPGHTAAQLGALLDSVGGPKDRIWTQTGNYPPMRMDGPASELPAGGHGLVRYTTVAHEPGRSVTWRFDDVVGIDGTHRLEVLTGNDDGGPVLRHTIEGRMTGSMRLAWPLAVRWLHDACLEEVLDQAGAALTGRPAEPPRHGWWVRFLLWTGPSVAKEEEWASRQD